MYKLFMSSDGKVSIVIRLADNANIPFDPQNVDYQQYLAWIEAGNTVLPADENSNA